MYLVSHFSPVSKQQLQKGIMKNHIDSCELCFVFDSSLPSAVFTVRPLTLKLKDYAR